MGPYTVPTWFQAKHTLIQLHNKWDDILLHLVDFEQFSFAKDILLCHFIHMPFAHNMKELL
jgi:hypothetical protein